MKNKLTTAVVVAFAAALYMLGGVRLVHAAPNLIKNGDFEQVSPTTFLPKVWTVNDPQFSTGATVIVTQPGDTNTTNICWVAVCPPVFAGTYSMAFGTVGELGSISQSVQTKIGSHYTLSFDFLSDGGPDNEFKVTENSTVLFDGTDIPASNPATMFDPDTLSTVGWSKSDYQLMTFNFTATSSLTTITFAGQDGCFAAGPPCYANAWGNLGLDDVTLVDPADVPEPGSLDTLAIAFVLGGVGLARRSRRNGSVCG
jgi:hypothetical protein